MAAIELSAGTISYQDSGGDGTLIVFVHGVLMDGSVWDSVTERLTPEFRCVRPTWPLGSHLQAMNPGADLSLQGIALLVGEFLERLDLRNVILVQNDWGGAQVLIANGSSARIAKLVLAACEAFDNYPPGLPGRAIERAARIPGGLALLMRALRLTAVRTSAGFLGMDEQTTRAALRDGPLVSTSHYRPRCPIRPRGVLPIDPRPDHPAALGAGQRLLRPSGPGGLGR